jgi:hypothetical protein
MAAVPRRLPDIGGLDTGRRGCLKRADGEIVQSGSDHSLG